MVYFFSRYWQQIEPFCHGRLSDIQTHFPDASMHYAAADERQAIEFEYALSSFDHHRKPRGRKILNEEYDSLYIVYWEEDTDRDELRKEIKERGVKLKKVEFVDLSKYFSPCIECEPDRLGAYWEFRRQKCFGEVYSLSEIEDEAKALEKDGVIRFLARIIHQRSARRRRMRRHVSWRSQEGIWRRLNGVAGAPPPFPRSVISRYGAVQSRNVK